MNLSFNKKGNLLLDSIVVLVVLVVMGITGMFSYGIFTEVTDDLATDTSFKEEARNETLELQSRFPSVMDGAFAFALALIWILVLVASFMVDSHPIFFAISIILLLAILFASGLLSNAYNELETDAEISAYADEFPITSYILNNLLIFVLAIGGSVGLVLFAKSRIG